MINHCHDKRYTFLWGWNSWGFISHQSSIPFILPYETMQFRAIHCILSGKNTSMIMILLMIYLYLGLVILWSCHHPAKYPNLWLISSIPFFYKIKYKLFWRQIELIYRLKRNDDDNCYYNFWKQHWCFDNQLKWPVQLCPSQPPHQIVPHLSLYFISCNMHALIQTRSYFLHCLINFTF